MTTFTLASPHQLTEEIKKSRFVTHAAPIQTAQQALDFINQVTDITATHNCWAWKIGQQYRFNDDGEPTGTAGRPILSAIEGQQCDQIIVVVTRWFGGIKLGTGGLARAYGGGAARCLQQATLLEIIPKIQCTFHCYYHEWPILENKLNTLMITIEQQSFDGEGTTLTLSLPEKHFSALHNFVMDLTRGRVSVNPL